MFLLVVTQGVVTQTKIHIESIKGFLRCVYVPHMCVLIWKSCLISNNEVVLSVASAELKKRVNGTMCTCVICNRN